MFDREYFEKNEFVKKIYSFENLQCIEDQNDVMHIFPFEGDTES